MKLSQDEILQGQAPLSLSEHWATLSPEERDAALETLTEEEATAILYDWSTWARENQKVPDGEWFAWLIMAGRGFGKTRTGGETIGQWIEEGEKDPHMYGQIVRIALVAETAGDARDVLVEGESGILQTSPPWRMPEYEPSKRRLTWKNGDGKVIAEATTFAGKEPDQLRGPQFHKAWADELAKYQYPQETWDNIELSVRLGRKPQVVVTTTPKPIPLIMNLVKDPGVIVTTGSTYENIANLAPNFIKRVIQKYEGTRLGLQELHAKILEQIEGSLWPDEIISRNRVRLAPPDLDQIVVSVDPTVREDGDGDECGIVVVGTKMMRDKRLHGFVLEDLTAAMSPDTWAKTAVSAFHRWEANMMIGEVNQGGSLVKKAIHQVKGGESIPFYMLTAKRAKHVRAIPVAQLYEQNRVHHVGYFAELEQQLKLFTNLKYMGPGSPNNADAAVHGLSYTMDKTSRRSSRDPNQYATYRR